MARLGRLSGALVLETIVENEPSWFVIGDTKVPCDWASAGFVEPPERDVVAHRHARLLPFGAPSVTGTVLVLSLEGEEAARSVAERLTVARNGSVSERLWRLIVGEDEAESPTGRSISCGWLCEMPLGVWDVVRNAVLKCS